MSVSLSRDLVVVRACDSVIDVCGRRRRIGEQTVVVGRTGQASAATEAGQRQDSPDCCCIKYPVHLGFFKEEEEEREEEEEGEREEGW